MNRQPIHSSVIVSAGYDPGTNTMDVEFVSGRVYRYFMIPAEMFEALVKADSAGRYFNETIRERFPSQELTEL